jgi:predicted metalloprotease with PDZ domain
MVTHEYRVSVLPQSHELAVELSLTGAQGAVLLLTPTWVPGAYGLMKYGRDLMSIAVTDGEGKPLKWAREGWSGIRVQGATGAVRVAYKAAAYDPAWGELSGLVDAEYAVLLGTRLLYAPELGGEVDVAYVLPEGWAMHHPSGAQALAQNTFRYPSYAVLLDTPVVVGRFDTFTRTVAGTPFHFVFLDRCVGYAQQVGDFVNKLEKVCAEAKVLFGSYPFADYTFVFSFNPTAHWGLEHANATMCGLGELALIDDAHRARAVRVSAHELFHAWNVCRLKPEGLDRPSFEKAPTIESLWIAEGVTRYYEFILSVRAGEITPENFFSNVANYWAHLEAMPAFRRVSALDSSRATFLNHNKYPGSINASIDYYDLGMLVAFELDVQLRRRGRSLDQAFRAFYDRHVGQAGGFTHADVLAHFADVPELSALLETPGRVTTLETLAGLGIAAERIPVRYLGLVLKENAGPEVANVLDDGPSGESGLAAGDVIQRVEGFPYSHKALAWATAHLHQVRLEVLRGHQSVSVAVTPGTRQKLDGLRWVGDEAQLASARTWLAAPSLAWAKGQRLSLSSFENFHGIQTVV